MDIQIADRVEESSMDLGESIRAKKIIFIAWVPYNRRSESLAGKLNAVYYPIHILKYKKVYNIPIKYIYQSIKTFVVCIRERPDIIFVQNPPILCPLVAYLYSWIMGSKILIDSHSAAFMSKRWKWTTPIHRFLSNRAIANVVTNNRFGSLVTKWGANPFILRDIPIVFPEMSPPEISSDLTMVFICTYSDDEPIDEVLKAATDHPGIHFYITGDLANLPRHLRRYHRDNVTFTDFLSEEEYVGLLQACDGVLVLTEREHTLLRGACESVSIGKPLVISDTELLREYFPKGTIHVKNNREGIREGVEKLFKEKERLENEIVELRDDRWVEWETKFGELMHLIDQGVQK